jgi:predicted neuraminidase
MTRSRRLLLGLFFCFALLALDLAWRPPVLPPALAREVSAKAEPSPNAGAARELVLQAQGRIPMPEGARVAHASSLLAMPRQHPWSLIAFWFAGSKEAAPDVNIAASVLDRDTGQWSPAHWVVDRRTLASQLGHGVSRLGNPVAWLDGEGRMHVFVVATGLGGWAASRIVHLRQSEFDNTVNATDSSSRLRFHALRELPLSWFWNTSFLVRAAPLDLSDGGMVLPVYFELGHSYPVALRFDRSGEFRGMVRMSDRKHLMQPTLLTLGPQHWLALMRNTSLERKIAAVQTTDGGLRWSDLEDLSLSNPDSSVAGMTLEPQRMVLAHNSLPHSRAVLDLSESSNGRDWRLVRNLARGEEKDEFSYPAMAWSDDSLWVSYTDRRQGISWQRFGTQNTAQSTPDLR